MVTELEQRWEVLVRSEESGIVETVQVTTPYGRGFKDDAVAQAISRCFRGAGEHPCRAMSARPLPDWER